MSSIWTAVSDFDWQDSVGMYEDPERMRPHPRYEGAWVVGPDEEEPDMDDVAVAVLARLNTAIMALKAATEEIESLPPLADRELLNILYNALAYATSAEAECKLRLSL